MAVADGAAGTAAERSRAWVVALVLSAGSIAINVFALYNYKWRLGRIRSGEPVEWGDPRGPATQRSAARFGTLSRKLSGGSVITRGA